MRFSVDEAHDAEVGNVESVNLRDEANDVAVDEFGHHVFLLEAFFVNIIELVKIVAHFQVANFLKLCTVGESRVFVAVLRHEIDAFYQRSCRRNS